MEAKISNIVLNNDRFDVSIVLSNGITERRTFLPDVTATDILAWVNLRLEYYQSIEDKKLQLEQELAQKEYNLEIFDKLYATDPIFKSKVDNVKLLQPVEIIDEPIEIIK